MLEGVRVQVRPVLGTIDEVRVTAPANPLAAATVIVDVPALPGATVTVGRDERIVKSWICRVRVDT
jgi:hypothetical protein